VVLISGEPGIGKSRLTAVLSEHIESEPHTRLRYFCAPHHQHSVLYPFIAQLERAAGFTRDDTIDGQLLLSLDDHLAAAGALNRQKTLCSCSRFFTGSMRQTTSRSTAMLYASLRHNSWRSPRNKGQQSRALSGIA
jgi:predicted ATPase